MEMKAQLTKAARMHAEGELERAKTNILVYMNNSAGIGEHSDIVEAIQGELDKMAHAEDRIEILKKYFNAWFCHFQYSTHMLPLFYILSFALIVMNQAVF